MAEKKLADKIKKKKKKWVSMHASGIFGGRLLCECPVYETPQIMGRAITVNFMTLAGDMKKQHINLTFKVTDINEGKGNCQLVRYYIIPSSLRRFVRKGREKIDDSFMAKTKDEKFVRIKPMLVTNSTTHESVVTNLRVTTRKILQNIVPTYTYEQLSEEIITYKLQKYLRDILHKTYPLKICEIRDFVLMEKAPIRFAFTPEDIADIIAKSRNAKKGKEDRKKKDEETEEAEEEQKEETP